MNYSFELPGITLAIRRNFKKIFFANLISRNCLSTSAEFPHCNNWKLPIFECIAELFFNILLTFQYSIFWNIRYRKCEYNWNLFCNAQPMNWLELDDELASEKAYKLTILWLCFLEYKDNTNIVKSVFSNIRYRKAEYNWNLFFNEQPMD